VSPTIANLQRTKPFGTRTYFAKTVDRLVTAVRLSALRFAKPEDDARSLGTLHFAYWLLLSRKQLQRLHSHDGSRAGASGQVRDEMLFLSDFSGDWEEYLEGFNRNLLIALDTAWGRAVDWKQKMQVHDYLDFVRGHELQPQYYVSPYMTAASVDDVHSALYVSEELDRFAFDALGRDADSFGAMYEELCIVLGRCLAA
jgi:hypothetical protein